MMEHQRLHVVAAEDDDGEWFLMEEVLRELPNVGNVVRVANGVALLDWLRSPDHVDPDVILLDLRMPIMDGFDALAAIRSDQLLRSHTVLVLSTSGDQVDVNRAYELGASGYLVKPQTLEALSRRLRALAEYWIEVETPT